MKANLFFISCAFSLLSLGMVTIAQESGSMGAEIHCTPDLMPLVSGWVKAYSFDNNDNPIILTTTGNSDADAKSFDHLTFLTGDAYRPVSDSVWSMVVARDVIVPVINSANPFIKSVGRQGISSGALSKALSADADCNWGTLLRNSQNEKVHFYALDNERVRYCLKGFLKTASLQTLKIKWLNESELIEALQKDPLSIGICGLRNLISDEKSAICPGLSYLPIDKNGNGRLDYMEDIYTDVSTFLRGVWIGKYPRSLISNVYVVCKNKPDRLADLAFLQFILSDKHQPEVSNSYGGITKEERESLHGQLFTEDKIDTPDQQVGGFSLFIILLISGFVAVIGIVVVSITVKRHAIPLVEENVPAVHNDGFDEIRLQAPGGLLYDKSHMWAFMEKDGGVTVGIDDFIQHVTGKITRVLMKKAGDQVKKGEIILSILQSGKMLNLYAPVSGIVVKHNEQLYSNSSLINNSPYNDGWVYKINPNDWFTEAKQLTNADRYKIWLKSEFLWLKDFLALALGNNNPELANVVLQDGGTIREGALADFGPVVWEDFQTKFLDVIK